MSIRILLGQDNLIELEGGIMDAYRNFDRNCAIYYKQNGGTKEIVESLEEQRNVFLLTELLR